MWIDIKEKYPEPIQGNKVLGHNGECAFECEFDDGCWCNTEGANMTHWMPLPPSPNAIKERSCLENIDPMYIKFAKLRLKEEYANILYHADVLEFTDDDWRQANIMADQLIYGID